MKLRRKIAVFISVVALFILAGTYLLLHFSLLNRFDKLDEAALHDKLNETVYSYQEQLQNMKRDLLHYSAGGNIEVIDPFDMILFINQAGQTVYGGVYDTNAADSSPLTPELQNLVLLINSHLLPLSGPEDYRTGVVRLEKGPMLIALTPVNSGSMNNGTAIAGRMLDQDEIIRIGHGSHSGIKVAAASSDLYVRSGGKNVWMTSPSRNLMSIHTSIHDLFGNPGIVLTVEQPRQIYLSGLESVLSFRLFYFATILLLCIICMIFVHRFVLRRMASLVRNIRAVTNSQNLSIRIKNSGKDEFSDIEHEVNRMISSLESAQEELRMQSMLDPLTQLPNRSLFFAKLNEAIQAAKNNGRRIALLFIDLDHFKTVNDTLGHDFGDAMLKEIAVRISKSVGENDVVSRLGGDEFTILLSGIPDTEGIPEELSRIQKALSEPHLIQGHYLYITASIGVSIYPENGEDADFLVRQADLAMLHVKESGRNHIFKYSESLEESVRRKNVLGQQLLSAAANNEFEVFYQPILSLEAMRVSKVEALLRWSSPTYGSVQPSEFIPLAESSGSIVGIGGWVLRRVCADLRKFLDAGLELSVAVNISAMQLMQPGLANELMMLLHEYHLSPSNLELEITESILISGETIFSSLLELREHGFRISIDDFGTGFSSLSYLRRFPVDMIKIDRSFVSEITAEQKGDTLVKAIIELCHNLGLRVVSEGVELKEQFELLHRLGSDEMQGYYISKPVHSSEVISLLSYRQAPGDMI